MLVYQFDIAGLYAGQTEADESPLEPGVYLLPARCTEVAPPERWPDDRWPRFNGVAWELVNKREPVAEPDPVAKLTAFLQLNPDVAALLDLGKP
jgi:hypothetical protein